MKGAIMSFKIWVQIEEVDDSGEHKNNITEDTEVGEYEDMAAARAAMDKIIDAA